MIDRKWAISNSPFVMKAMSLWSEKNVGNACSLWHESSWKENLVKRNHLFVKLLFFQKT